VCFVFNEKVHIGGFKFSKQNKAFERLYAADNDFIYGDSYVVKSRAIEGIGNNVTIGYADMDFGDNGAKSVEICLRCERKNSFQIITVDSNDTAISTMVEADPVKDYSVVCYDLEKVVTGKNTVSLVFLPGCDIDIEWINFIERNDK
jgi:beta-galactosidase